MSTLLICCVLAGYMFIHNERVNPDSNRVFDSLSTNDSSSLKRDFGERPREFLITSFREDSQNLTSSVSNYAIRSYFGFMDFNSKAQDWPSGQQL